MLPTMNRSAPRPAAGRSTSHLPQYLRRIVKWRQMDVEYSFWQMLYLCISPKVVYQHTKYHKQTKNQWARDDPAFVVIVSFFIAVSAMAFSTAYGRSIAQAGVTVLSVVLLDFLLVGIALASLCCFLSNQYLREEASGQTHAVEQRVEWLYSFDVHCNSYFPLFLLLYVLQYFLSPLLLAPGFVPALLSNLLYALAFSYYHYINFLGYDGEGTPAAPAEQEQIKSTYKNRNKWKDRIGTSLG
eukprot:TRINITY_DN9783_c0_g1_i3.p1 TRINITY_DN9783_c0_g1~~TRINITY_DN9783_c0_g1_i3.p1  ORF type:complete len:242 (+),score=34.66 TRINITY_DN9783_c0_g1_i3:304-1029(+)